MKYMYEFIGTFFLVLTVGMTVMAPDTSGLMAPLAIGTALAVMIYAGAHVSGGHYNPAVSLAAFIRGKLKPNALMGYWIAQLLAGVAAAIVTCYFKGGHNMMPMEPNMYKLFLAEFLFTFALCYVFLNVATTKETSGNSYFGFAIGFTVMVGAYAVGAISGGAFNPAVALGLTILNMSTWSNLIVFIVANLLGAACSAFVFMMAHKKEMKKA